MKKYLDKQKIYTYAMAFCGFIMLCIYIWFRFIRTRIPREIPFNLTIVTFIVIIIIIISLIYILYRLNYPKAPTQFISHILLKVALLYKPLAIFDSVITQNPKTQNKILFISSYIIERYKLYYYKVNTWTYFIFNILPKILVLISFMFDIFVLHKIDTFYYALLLNIIPLLFFYYIYNLKKQVELYILYLETRFYIKVLSTLKEEDDGLKSFMCPIRKLKDHKDDEPDLWNGVVPFKDVRFFIDMQVNNLVYYEFDYDLYEYTCVETDYGREEFAIKHNLKLPQRTKYIPDYDEASLILHKDFNYIIPKVINIKAFLKVYDKMVKTIFVKSLINKVIIIGYILCWLYILITSIHSLDISDFFDLAKDSYSKIEDPFTEIKIQHENKH